MITIKNLCKKYEKAVLEDFSFTFESGRYAIMGESGIGKTTLLNLIMGLEKPDSGSIETGASKFGTVFQENRLCENVNAVKNIQLVTDKPRDEIVTHLERAGLKDSLNKPVRELSGGMKRRVAIVRALINLPETVMMDEPMKGLDEKLRGDIINYIKEMTENRVLIFITHEKTEALMLTPDIYNFTSGGLVKI